MSQVPDIEWTEVGITVPEETDILAGVLADLDAAFGGGMNPSLETPQGQLAISITQAIENKNANIQWIANQVDPDNASGAFQDAIGRIYFIDRISGTGTVVTGRCYGKFGTVIPQASVVQDTNGYFYAANYSRTIGNTGYVDIEFQNIELGPIACAIGAMNIIYTQVIGWDRVENLAAGTIGRNVETRGEFEERRRNSVALNANNSRLAVYAAILELADVVDCYVIENFTDATINMGATSFPVVKNSLYIAVAGADDADIAKAIYKNKGPGCNLNGSTTYIIEDDSYDAPRPSYTMRWVTPAPLRTYFKIQIAANAGLPSDIDAQIKNAILNAFNGGDGRSRARIGSTIYATRFAAPLLDINDELSVLAVTLGSTSAADQISLQYGIDQLPSLDPSDISIVVI